MMKRLVLSAAPSVFVAVTALVACNGQTLDLGDNGSMSEGADGSVTTPVSTRDAAAHDASLFSGSDGDDDSEGDSSTGLISPSSPLDAAALQLPLVPLADAGDPTAADQEIWTGYTENYQFPQSQSDLVKLTFTQLGDGGISGHAIFGSLPLFPPVTDPNVGYPYADSESDGLTGLDLTVIEGFAFTMKTGSLVANRLQASLDQHEMQASWCTYQKPFLDTSAIGATIYDCLPNVGGSGSTADCSINLNWEGQEVPVNCNRWTFCSLPRVCGCTATACTATPGNPITFDLQVNGGNADGSVLLNEGGSPTTLHLTRQ